MYQAVSTTALGGYRLIVCGPSRAARNPYAKGAVMPVLILLRFGVALPLYLTLSPVAHRLASSSGPLVLLDLAPPASAWTLTAYAGQTVRRAGQHGTSQPTA